MSHRSDYTHCHAQLTVFSVVLITALSGFCGGIAWALIMALLQTLDILQSAIFNSLIINLFTFPLIGLFLGGFFSLIGYPIFRYINQLTTGLRLSGHFQYDKTNEL
ncbi:MAG TPA: hypothetical protein DCS49_01855 [Gammaproteobacteria bacterium]|nr:hypothetical protein [Gammaproteobacteria bacterium]